MTLKHYFLIVLCVVIICASLLGYLDLDDTKQVRPLQGPVGTQEVLP